MNLSANFTLKELTKSDTATRLGLDNTPDEATIENLKALCENVLQPVREHFGKSVTVNSAYRSPESNAAVNANANTPFLLYKPFNGFPSKVCVSLITPKAMIPAMLYVSK